MGGAPRHCSLRPRTHHGPWSPPIHHGCPRPRIFYGHLENSLPLSLRLYVLSLSLVSRFPLGPSLCSALVGACLVCSALVGACLVCSALVGACLVCSALVGVCLVCSALVGVCLVCAALVGVCLVCAALVGARPARVTSRLRRPARVTSRLRRPARVTSRLRRPARVTSRLCGFVRPALVGSCLIGPTWTWPSPGSTSAPPPSWIMLCVRRLEAALWGGGLCHESGCHSPHYNCTSPMDCIFHHSLHSHIPIHHYTNHTAVTNH